MFIGYKWHSSLLNLYSIFWSLMILSLLILISLHAQCTSSFWLSGFLGSVVCGSVVRDPPVRNTFYPPGTDFTTIAELVLLISYLSWESCQMSLWTINSAFISSTSFFPRYINFLPQLWGHWSTSNPNL